MRSTPTGSRRSGRTSMRWNGSSPAKSASNTPSPWPRGTAALHLALLLSGVGPGDEVLTSTLTFAATANAVTYVGAQPVFVDSERDTWNMDPDLLAEELAACARRGRLPKAAVVVDIYGQCADYEPILDACRAYGVPVIEDAAEALGATYRGRAAGTFGRFGCFSFNGNKIITTSGGGMLVCRARRTWPTGPGSSPPRPATRPRTTSTPRSATTTG